MGVELILPIGIYGEKKPSLCSPRVRIHKKEGFLQQLNVHKKKEVVLQIQIVAEVFFVAKKIQKKQIAMGLQIKDLRIVDNVTVCQKKKKQKKEDEKKKKRVFEKR